MYPPLQGHAEYSHCPKNLLCSTFLSLPPLPTLSNHWSFYFLHSFAFSKTSYSWNSILEQDSQPPHLFPIVAQARERGPWAHQPSRKQVELVAAYSKIPLCCLATKHFFNCFWVSHWERDHQKFEFLFFDIYSDTEYSLYWYIDVYRYISIWKVLLSLKDWPVGTGWVNLFILFMFMGVSWQEYCSSLPFPVP